MDYFKKFSGGLDGVCEWYAKSYRHILSSLTASMYHVLHHCMYLAVAMDMAMAMRMAIGLAEARTIWGHCKNQRNQCKNQ